MTRRLMLTLNRAAATHPQNKTPAKGRGFETYPGSVTLFPPLETLFPHNKNIVSKLALCQYLWVGSRTGTVLMLQKSCWPPHTRNQHLTHPEGPLIEWPFFWLIGDVQQDGSRKEDLTKEPRTPPKARINQQELLWQK